ncbi:hypothetical protein AY599_01600 [Leptolyngbya valderiana BDU 20041]|nr:hypothetical protein AY599_01600 [Leptolyngbya valderiana BDU 20041]
MGMRRAGTARFALVAMATAVMPAVAQGPCDTRIPPPDVVPAVAFGTSVAVDGDFWFISDLNARVLCPGIFGCTSGAVHVYEMVDGQLEFMQMITPPVPRLGDAFGGVLDTHGGRLIVGSRLQEWPGLAARGGAFVYEFDGAQWALTSTIRPPEGVDPRLADKLGSFVTIEGNTAYLNPEGEEIVFAFELEDDAWAFDQMIESPDGLPGSARFGSRVVPDDPWLFINAPEDSTAVDRGGSVYVFRRQPDGSITFHQKLMPFDAPGGVESNQFFGVDVGHHQGTLAIGAYGAMRGGVGTGAVLTYELVDDAWTFKQELLPPPSSQDDALGLPVTVREDVILATATLARTPTTHDSLHYFKRGHDGMWKHAAELIPEVPFFSDHYASSHAIRNGVAVVGAMGDSDGMGEYPGAAYQFDLSCFDCRPDFDADGALTIFDFLTFLNLFEDGDAAADFDSDGELTIFDFLAYQDAFDAGCE